MYRSIHDHHLVRLGIVGISGAEKESLGPQAVLPSPGLRPFPVAHALLLQRAGIPSAELKQGLSVQNFDLLGRRPKQHSSAVPDDSRPTPEVRHRVRSHSRRHPLLQPEAVPSTDLRATQPMRPTGLTAEIAQLELPEEGRLLS